MVSMYLQNCLHHIAKKFESYSLLQFLHICGMLSCVSQDTEEKNKSYLPNLQEHNSFKLLKNSFFGLSLCFLMFVLGEKTVFNQRLISKPFLSFLHVPYLGCLGLLIQFVLFLWIAGIIDECCPERNQITNRWSISEAVQKSRFEMHMTKQLGLYKNNRVANNIKGLKYLLGNLKYILICIPFHFTQSCLRIVYKCFGKTLQVFRSVCEP